MSESSEGKSAEQLEIERVTRDIGRVIGAVAKEAGGLGFALLMFDFGAEGSMAYASNAARGDMIKGLEELLLKLKESAS